jgi:hypothetical protein
MTGRDLERSAERFADAVHENVTVQVKLAWALERDRLYAELAELRDEILSQSRRIAYMENAGPWNELHSVKVPE